MSTAYPDPDLLWKRQCDEEERAIKELYDRLGITENTTCRDCAHCDIVLDRKGSQHGICWEREELIDHDAHPWDDMECGEGEF